MVFCIYSLLRHLLKGRCRLGAFSRSLLAWHFAPSSGEVTGSSEIFPLPLPYPEVFQKKHRAEDARGALKKGVVAVVTTSSSCNVARVLAMRLEGRSG